MKQDYIQKIKEKCVEANHEIMELKFGCRIKRGLTDAGGYKCFVLGITDNVVLSSYAPYQKNYAGRHYDKVEHIQILGRDITLADVLLAIQQVQSIACYPQSNGNLCIQVEQDDKWKNWNLKLPMHEQEESVLKFISELMS